jgi:hypothetical protein
MNGKTDEEIAANIAAIQRQSMLGKRGRGGVTRRAMTMATVPSAPARATTLNNHLNNNNNDDHEESLSTTADTAAIPRRSGRKQKSTQQHEMQPSNTVGHQEESLSTTADTAAIPRRSGRKQKNTQQHEKQPSAQQHQPQKSGRGSPRKDGSNATTTTNPGSKTKKKIGNKRLMIYQQRDANPSAAAAAAAVNVASARSSRKSTRQKEGAASSTAAVKPDIDFHFDPIHGINIPHIDGLSKGTVSQTIFNLLDQKGHFVSDPNHLPACYWDVVNSMDDEDASFLPDGNGYKFRPEKEQLLLKNVANHWKSFGHKKAPKIFHNFPYGKL